MKKIPFIRILHGINLLILFYLLWIRPHLDSTTPVYHIFKGLLMYFVPLLLVALLAFYCQTKLLASYKNQALPPFPKSFSEPLPPVLTRFVLKGLLVFVGVIIVATVLCFMLFNKLSVIVFG